MQAAWRTQTHHGWFGPQGLMWVWEGASRSAPCRGVSPLCWLISHEAFLPASMEASFHLLQAQKVPRSILNSE